MRLNYKNLKNRKMLFSLSLVISVRTYELAPFIKQKFYIDLTAKSKTKCQTPGVRISGS